MANYLYRGNATPYHSLKDSHQVSRDAFEETRPHMTWSQNIPDLPLRHPFMNRHWGFNCLPTRSTRGKFDATALQCPSV